MSLLDDFESATLADIQRWVDARRQEDLHVDFKLLVRAPTLTKDDRKNLAIAISGFANSDGGIIVWGVDARKDGSDVDGATAIAGVRSADAVMTELLSATGTATSPLVQGVQHRLLGTSEDGVILTFVPVSDSGPHMTNCGDGRYYKRSGSAFYRMEHFDVADMFGRRVRPQLLPVLNPSVGSRSGGPGGRTTRIDITVELHNVGRGLARFPFLSIHVLGGCTISPYELGNGVAGLPRVPAAREQLGWRTYGGGVDHVVHASTQRDITILRCDVREGSTHHPDVVVEYLCAADGVQERVGELRVKGESIIAMATEALAAWKD